MLARYQIKRGQPAAQLPAGRREDTRKHTHHVLRPEPEMVAQFLARPDEQAWRKFATAYENLLRKRLKEDRAPFDALAERASREDVYLGCNCPTRQNPDPRHCHTIVALDFMKRMYPALDVVFPPAVRNAR